MKILPWHVLQDDAGFSLGKNRSYHGVVLAAHESSVTQLALTFSQWQSSMERSQQVQQLGWSSSVSFLLSTAQLTDSWAGSRATPLLPAWCSWAWTNSFLLGEPCILFHTSFIMAQTHSKHCLQQLFTQGCRNPGQLQVSVGRLLSCTCQQNSWWSKAISFRCNMRSEFFLLKCFMMSNKLWEHEVQGWHAKAWACPPNWPV